MAEPPSASTSNPLSSKEPTLPSASESKGADAKGKAPEAPAAPAMTDEELESLLNREATAFQRNIEVERILKAFKLNPFEILGVEYDATPADIKKRYKHLSLFIHPDKAKHERAPEAFHLLKKSESDLSDEAKRAELDATVAEARLTILKANSFPSTILDSDSRLKQLVPPFKEQWRLKVKEILIDEEVRRRKAYKMNLANEGREAKQKEEEVASKKRKAEEDQRWEENREQRVDSWRSFASGTGGKKKKKTKVQVLG